MEKSPLIASIRQKYTAVRGVLHERGRRIWAASEARQLGRGGITLVGKALHMSHATIRRGLQEIESEIRTPLPQERPRQPGGGRKKGSEQQPTLKASLDALVEPTAKGDPMAAGAIVVAVVCGSIVCRSLRMSRGCRFK